jgi:cytochrome c556
VTNSHKLALAALLLPAAGLVIAAAPHPAYKARHQNFETMGKAMKATFDEFKRPAPNLAVFKSSADILAESSVKVKGQFPKGTGPAPGIKTEALPAIWDRPADFAAAADRLVGATKGYQAAVATGDLAGIQKAAGAVGGACKNCHDSFRKPKA